MNFFIFDITGVYQKKASINNIYIKYKILKVPAEGNYSNESHYVNISVFALKDQ